MGRRWPSHVVGAVPPVLRRARSRPGASTRPSSSRSWTAPAWSSPCSWEPPRCKVEGDRLTCLTFTDLSDQKAHERRSSVSSRSRSPGPQEIREEYALNLAETQKLEALGVLAGGIAHDFNNLLDGASSATRASRSPRSPPATARAPLKQVELAATRSTDLARQMLAYSGKGRSSSRSSSLADSVTEPGGAPQGRDLQEGALSVDFARDTPTIEADATQLRQVIMNLITNASEAIGDASGIITVRSRPLDADRAYLSGYESPRRAARGQLRALEVADTGTGMDAATRERIFDPFFTTKFTGRGLGLAAVQGIVRGHHGAMKVESRDRGGDDLHAHLPGIGHGGSRRPAPARRHRRGRASGTVLVVDDDDAVRGMAVRMVASLGFEVVSAA